MSIKHRLAYSAAGLAAAITLVPLALAQAATLTDTQLSSVLSLLSSYGVASSTLAKVTHVLQDDGVVRPPAWMGSTTPLAMCPQFKHDFVVGQSDTRNEGEVSKLQKYLKTSGAYNGPVTGYYGKMTQASLDKWEMMASSTATTTQGVPNFHASPRALFAHYCNTMKRDDNEGQGDHKGPPPWYGGPPQISTTSATIAPH